MGLDLALEAEPNPDNALDIKAVEEEVVEEELAAEPETAAVAVLELVVDVAAAAEFAVNYTRECFGLLVAKIQGVESKLSLEYCHPNFTHLC